MHIADLSKGMLGANGIVGGGPPLICGPRWPPSSRDGGVAIAFFGDGASNQGTTRGYEHGGGVEPAGDLRCENNGYAESTSSTWRSVDAGRPRGGLRHARRRGRRHRLLRGLRSSRRGDRAGAQGGGPTLLEVKLTRYYGHFEGDQQTYRGPARSTTSSENGLPQAVPGPRRRDRTAHRRPARPGRRSGRRAHRRGRHRGQGGAAADTGRPAHRRLRQVLSEGSTNMATRRSATGGDQRGARPGDGTRPPSS